MALEIVKGTKSFPCQTCRGRPTWASPRIKDGLRPPCGEGWKTEAGELLGMCVVLFNFCCPSVLRSGGGCSFCSAFAPRLAQAPSSTKLAAAAVKGRARSAGVTGASKQDR